jgi:hypothetical protein
MGISCGGIWLQARGGGSGSNGMVEGGCLECALKVGWGLLSPLSTHVWLLSQLLSL